MKVIDINMNVTSQQYADFHKAERVDLRLNVNDQIGDTICLYSIEGIKALFSKRDNEKWRPSEEQIEMLDRLFKVRKVSLDDKNILLGLIADLQKL